jgi:hypothetical protein
MVTNQLQTVEDTANRRQNMYESSANMQLILRSSHVARDLLGCEPGTRLRCGFEGSELGTALPCGFEGGADLGQAGPRRSPGEV